MALRRPDTVRAPQWPSEPIEPRTAWVDYSALADEFLVYFSGAPVPAISSPLNAPGFRGTAVMFALGEHDEATDEIVGVQVIPMLLGAVLEQPGWAALAWAAMAGDFGAELLQERLPAFLADVRDAFDRYWTPPPSMEQQLAEITRAREHRPDAGQGPAPSTRTA